VIVGGSYKALAFAVDALGNSFHEQLASGITNRCESIKTIFQGVEMSVSLQSHIFNIGLKSSS
jgi:hypothetical protein